MFRSGRATAALAAVVGVLMVGLVVTVVTQLIPHSAADDARSNLRDSAEKLQDSLSDQVAEARRDGVASERSLATSNVPSEYRTIGSGVASGREYLDVELFAYGEPTFTFSADGTIRARSCVRYSTDVAAAGDVSFVAIECPASADIPGEPSYDVTITLA